VRFSSCAEVLARAQLVSCVERHVNAVSAAIAWCTQWLWDFGSWVAVYVKTS
jgi:hypothetical protein